MAMIMEITKASTGVAATTTDEIRHNVNSNVDGKSEFHEIKWTRPNVDVKIMIMSNVITEPPGLFWTGSKAMSGSSSKAKYELTCSLSDFSFESPTISNMGEYIIHPNVMLKK
ncbi:hypothetical protein BDQ17DRAFT_1422704 [Cyathus striatus]|nr:hypothetical protein BDQ17DRAFT_1422704 [Cyathus striatus]